MIAKWVAGTVRAGALPTRRLGAVGARALAGSASLADAVATVARSPYGRFVGPEDSLGAAQHGVAQALLWHLRVLAGWVPAEGVRALRLLAGWFELANLDEHVRKLVDPGQAVDPPFRLGTLATAWPRLAGTPSLADLRAALGSTAWGDPGVETPGELLLTVRLAWADRLAAGVAPASGWARSAAALLVAREAVAYRRQLPGRAAASADRLLGRGWQAAETLSDLAGRLAPATADALADVMTPADLWRAEARWWQRLRADGHRLLAGSGFGLRPVIGAVALLAVDAWQVRAALGVAARGGDWVEVVDALA